MATILVIDDDAAMRRLILRILKPTGHTLLEARDGAGLAVLERHDADLGITDLLMPRKEGIATMREISARRPTVKFLAISAGGELRNPAFLEVAKVMGAEETLAKPFRPRALLDAVRRLLQKA